MRLKNVLVSDKAGYISIKIFEGRLDKFMNNQEILYDFKACFKSITKAETVTINYEGLDS